MNDVVVDNGSSARHSETEANTAACTPSYQETFSPSSMNRAVPLYRLVALRIFHPYDKDLDGVLEGSEHPDMNTSSNNALLPGQQKKVPPEAAGLALDIFARGSIMVSTLFLGPALLTLASDAARRRSGCAFGDDDQEVQDGFAVDIDYVNNFDSDYNYYHGGEADPSCDVRVFFGLMKPSTLLSNISMMSGLVNAAFLPIFGAVVDHTPHRRLAGIVSGALVTFFKGLDLLLLRRQTWPLLAALQSTSGLVYFLHITAAYAYTSELSRSPKLQTTYNALYAMIMFVSLASCLTFVLFVSTIVQEERDDLGTSRISQCMTFTVSGICFGYSWKYLFRDRPALSALPKDASGSKLSTLTLGFRKIGKSMKRIWKELPSLRYYFSYIALADSAMSSIVTLGMTVMSLELRMSATEIGMSNFVTLMFGIPGSKLGEWIGLQRGSDPLTSIKLCILTFILNTTMAGVVLSGPEMKGFVFIFAALWGLCLGWAQAVHPAILCTIIPEGQSAELMGFYIFCGQILSWLPPLVFTLVVESGHGIRTAFFTPLPFFLGAMFCLMQMGSYDEAVRSVREPIQQEEGPLEKSIPHDAVFNPKRNASAMEGHVGENEETAVSSASKIDLRAEQMGAREQREPVRFNEAANDLMGGHYVEMSSRPETGTFDSVR